MSAALSDADLVLLHREAEKTAARLVHRLRLPAHEREDLRQELLVDLISRIATFDPARGTLGAFAGTVVAHGGARLAARIRRYRAVFAPVSLDDSVAGAEDVTLGETIPESSGYPVMMGQTTDAFAAVERRLDLDRTLCTLPDADLTLCAQLVHRTPTQLSQAGVGARATLYRRLQEIRLQLMTAGLAAAA